MHESPFHIFYTSKQRIIGGGNVQCPHQFPWLVTVNCANPGWLCTGSLIDPEWVLTAGENHKKNYKRLNT